MHIYIQVLHRAMGPAASSYAMHVGSRDTNREVSKLKRLNNAAPIREINQNDQRKAQTLEFNLLLRTALDHMCPERPLPRLLQATVRGTQRIDNAFETQGQLDLV
jgi:hypothetical protein